MKTPLLETMVTKAAAVTEMRSHLHDLHHNPVFRTLLIGVVTGITGGMAAFMTTQSPVLPTYVEPWMPAAMIFISGAYTHLFSSDIVGSISAMLVAFMVGIATISVGWVAPLWILEFPRGAGDILLPGLLKRAAVGGLTTFLILFLAGYLLTLSIAGFLDP